MTLTRIPFGMSEYGIIEEVTNANGTAVNFENGLMICFGQSNTTEADLKIVKLNNAAQGTGF